MIGHSHTTEIADNQDQLGTLSNGRNVGIRDFLAVLALSIHAIFEGLAIGLESHSEDVWILFLGKRFKI